MKDNIETIVYVVKNANQASSNAKVLDYIMDSNCSIICWKTKQNVQQFLSDTGLDNRYIAVQTTISNIRNELIKKNKNLDEYKIRVIEGIDYE